MDLDLPFEFVFTVVLEDTKKLIKARNCHDLIEKCRNKFKFTPEDELIIVDYLTKVQIDEDVFVPYVIQNQNILGFSIGVQKIDIFDLTNDLYEEVVPEIIELFEEVLPVILCFSFYTAL